MKMKHGFNTARSARATAQVLAGGAALLLACAGPASAKAKAGKIVWQESFESGMALAKKTGKPMFVDFYATWCGPCKMLEAEVYPDPAFIKAARGYVMVKVDGEKRPDLMKKYATDAQGRAFFPTLIFFSPAGKPRKVQVGAPPMPEIIKLMDAYRKPSKSASRVASR